MTLRLTERDGRMLAKCAICRWLTTDQLRRLYFPKATQNAVQKRLRKLADAGYLGTWREHPTAEAVHALAPLGKRLVEERGIETTLPGEVPKQIEHLLGVNEIRIALETGGVEVAYFFAYWELANLGWINKVIPDAVFAVRTPEMRTFLVEYDRGTEPLGKLVQKLVAYEAGVQGFAFEAVVLVTEQTRRVDVLAREMRGRNLSGRVLVSTMEEIVVKGLFGVGYTEIPARRRFGLVDKVDRGAD